MSQKWIRAKKWEEEFFPPALWPVQRLLRAFSTVPLAIFLLCCVAMYGTLASVPIGLIALAPTYVIYLASLLLTIFTLAAIPVALSVRVMIRRRTLRATRFGVAFLVLLGLGLLSVWLWHRYAWPMMRYDRAAGTGFRLFADSLKRTRPSPSADSPAWR